MTTLRSAAELALPRPGEVVGKYRIEAVLGSGGMGVVMSAFDPALGRSVAIKFLAPSKDRHESATARFLREARAAAAIQSEHVVRVFEVGTLPNQAPYIVMERLRGVDLAHVITTRGGLPVEEAVDYVLQGCEALAEAHGMGIVHRDLKPQNLFLTQRADGSACVKILDFGISKAASDDAVDLTATDAVMGTPLYMSPEQVRSLKNVDRRTDIWSLGVILFELLTASPVFEATTASALCAMIAMDPPTPLRAKRPSAPPGLEAVILRCLHKDPYGRFGDVALLAEALAPFGSELGRHSAVRISRVVRSGAPGVTGLSGAAAALLPYAPTTTSVPGLPGSASPPLSPPHPTTQQTWNATQGRPVVEAKPAASAMVFALLGGFAAVALAMAVGVGWWMHASGRREGAPPEASPAPSLPPRPPAASAVAEPPPVPAPVPPPSAAPPTPKPATPSGASTRSTTTPPAPSPTPRPPGEDLEARKRLEQGRCDHMAMLLRSNDPKTNAQANQVKTMTCLAASGPQGATCQRSVCRSACSMLQDQDCLRRLDFAERNYPARF